jgi:Ion channel
VTAIRKFWFRYRSELLMWEYILVLALSPITDGHAVLGLALDLVLFAGLLVGASFMATKRIVLYVVYPLAGIWLACHFMQLLLSRPYLISPYVGLALSCAIIWGILSRFTRKGGVAGSSAIAEAIICYLVIAVAFSQLYWIMNRLFANCFDHLIPASQQSEFLYYSLTTLTTLGAGDINPVNHYVRFVAAFESVAGIFFLAIVIARLVAGYRADASAEQT